ncbi:sigma 54-interacting transcriptional regulator [uncultured Clostridium sp.]|uniref:sigma 54-interacting transcriptional regulator n=1 Tax=uncultured Clostridium sp. TaxID=59620 RepID=UPI0028EF4CD1|nr:sigma 54-interacting transcriptional regulator [uncultured Clostridium sp.]
MNWSNEVGKVAVIAYTKMTAQFYASQLKKLFKENISLEVYSVEDSNLTSIACDLIIASTHSIYEIVKAYISNYDDIVIADITLTKDSLEKLRKIPVGTSAMLVNTTLEMAVETIALIYNSGITHINMFPVYPTISTIPPYDLAITPGETSLVPSGVNNIIDIGNRVLSMRTIIDIAVRLNLDDMLKNEEFQSCFGLLAQSDVGLERLWEQVSVLEKKLDLIMQIFDGGILLLNYGGNISFINKSAEKMLSIDKKLVIGWKLKDVLSEFYNSLVTSLEIAQKDKIITFNSRLLSVSFYPLFDGAEALGTIILIREFTDIEKEQHKIRKQIIAKGHVAKYSFNDIAGKSKQMEMLKATSKKMALSDSSVLICGESGTGKELFAQSIHNSSNRRDEPFIAINCASIPENLLESELFGYSEGAFTGAKKGGKPGYFEQAHKGTLFLDEISEMDLRLQSRLLRVLQEKEVIRIGGDSVINVDVRIISATNRNLKALIKQGKFRQDLYYRLNVLSINIPPLCQRKDDIPLLIEQLKERFHSSFKITKEAMDLIKNCKWEGNVRELGNFVERLTCLDVDEVDVDIARQFIDEDEYCQPILKDEENKLFLCLINQKHTNLKNYYSILKLLETNKKTGVKLGRRSISELLQKEGLIISPQEVRTILKNLESLNMVTILLGRSGTEITEFGIKACELLDEKYNII